MCSVSECYQIRDPQEVVPSGGEAMCESSKGCMWLCSGNHAECLDLLCPFSNRPVYELVLERCTYIFSVCASVRVFVTDVTSLPQRSLGTSILRIAMADMVHLYRAIATVIGGLRRRDRRH